MLDLTLKKMHISSYPSSLYIPYTFAFLASEKSLKSTNNIKRHSYGF